MLSQFLNIKKSTGKYLLFAYLIMTGVIALHYHNTDINPFSVVQKGQQTDFPAENNNGDLKCEYIHQAASNIQLPNGNHSVIFIISLIGLLTFFSFNNISYFIPSFSNLRAPPAFPIS